MKIFYTTSLDSSLRNGNASHLDISKIAEETLPQLLKTHTGVNLVTYFVDSTPADERSVSRILADIRSADAFIGEMSIPSQTLGFEIAYANLHFVPSLYLYHTSIHHAAPGALIANNPTRKLWIKGYEKDNLENTIKNFLRMVERQMETARTSFMSTKEIDDYISRESDGKGISKGEIIRQILSAAVKNQTNPNE